eukprot:3666890-Alexandrium_andersonii.AAC.1
MTSATSRKTSWSFFSGVATRTPSGQISNVAPIQTTTDPEVVLRRARGYSTSVAQRSAAAHSLARSLSLPPAT